MKQLVLSVDEAAKVLSIGKTKLYAELASGKLKAVKLGKRTLITYESITDYIAELEIYPSKNQEV